MILFSYPIAYKVETGHTPFELVIGLHTLLPTKYILPSIPNDDRDPPHVRVLTN